MFCSGHWSIFTLLTCTPQHKETYRKTLIEYQLHGYSRVYPYSMHTESWPSNYHFLRKYNELLEHKYRYKNQGNGHSNTDETRKFPWWRIECIMVQWNVYVIFFKKGGNECQQILNNDISFTTIVGICYFQWL